MENLEKLSNELYGARYGIPIFDNVGIDNVEKKWCQIKEKPEILREAIKIKRDKWNEGDILNSSIIADCMLIDYESVDKIAYDNLIKAIYTNTDIARTVIDGAINGGYSFLLMSLWNPNLKLTEEQKAFAVDEAMNKIGTTRYKKERDEFSKKLDTMGITNDATATIDIDNSRQPIGVKAKHEYLYYLSEMLSDTQAHGSGEYDIRYYILKNPNWTLEEKQELIMNFWYNDETYDEYLERWEWGIINVPERYLKKPPLTLDKCELYDYSYEMILKFYTNKKIADKIWKEIQFCKQMHELRPQQWELTPKKRYLS